MSVKTTGIEDAISAIGSQDKLADAMGVKQQVVSYWKRVGYVPTGRVVEVEQLTGVPRQRLINPSITNLLDTAI